MKYVEYSESSVPRQRQVFNIDGMTYTFPHTFTWYCRDIFINQLIGSKTITITGFNYTDNYIWGDSNGLIFYDDEDETIPHWNSVETIKKYDIYTLEDIRNFIYQSKKYATPESVENN